MGHSTLPFTDRVEAGRALAAELLHLRSSDVVVVGLPRGGVPVAAEVAAAIDAPLDVIIVRKLGLPWQPELAMGAIGEEGVRVLSDELIRSAGVDRRELARVEASERAELERRAARYREVAPRIPLDGASVVVVDDGVATGSTARAACLVARAGGATRVTLATPVAPPGWERDVGPVADVFVAVHTPSPFGAIGRFYRNFGATSHDEVVACLRAAASRRAPDG